MTLRITAVGCNWCHALVDVGGPGWPNCPDCQHRADVARMHCDCSSCQRGGSVRLFPLDLADALARTPVEVLPSDILAALEAAGLVLPEDATPSAPAPLGLTTDDFRCFLVHGAVALRRLAHRAGRADVVATAEREIAVCIARGAGR